MALKVSVKHPDFPDGMEFHVAALGSFKNGKSQTLTAEQEETYYSMTGRTVKEGLADSTGFTVEGTAEYKRKEGGES